MKIIFLSFFSFIFNNLFCQITIVNEYKLPIAFVNLSDNNQTVLVKSDWSGSVEWSKLKGVGENDTIYFNHASYNSQWILKKNINHNDTIILTEKNYIFSEVVVTANQKPKKYQTINACYRSYQTNNDSLIYYTDGSVEYLTKTKKNKYDKRLKEYRVYQDSLYLTNLKERKISVNFKLARTPPPLTDYLPKHFFKSNSLSLSKNISGSFDILTKDNIKIGTVKKDSNYVTYYIDDIFSCITRDFTKYEAIQLKSDVTLIFKVSENNEHLLIDNFDNLVYSKIYRKYHFKHASEKKYTEIENVEEIFVEEVNFSNEVETDKYNNGFGFPQKSNFSTPFWQKCNCELYQIPPYSSLLLKP
jgi:hypothetical protein